MLTTIMFFYLMVHTAVRLISLVLLLIFQSTNLPLVVVALVSLMIVYALILALLRYRKKETRLRHMVQYYSLDILVVIFNLFFIAYFVPSEITAADTAITGTLIDVLIGIGFLIAAFFSMRGRKYVKIKQDFRTKKR